MVTAYPVANKAKSFNLCLAFVRGCGGPLPPAKRTFHAGRPPASEALPRALLIERPDAVDVSWMAPSYEIRSCCALIAYATWRFMRGSTFPDDDRGDSRRASPPGKAAPGTLTLCNRAGQCSTPESERLGQQAQPTSAINC